MFLIILISLAAWGVGLLAFASRVVNSTPPPDPPQADAIVALTGASTIRLEAAEALLEEGLGQRLLISGVNREATRKQVRSTLIAGSQAAGAQVIGDQGTGAPVTGPPATGAPVNGDQAAVGRAFDCCVDLGFRAENTLGNARETAPWVARHHYHTLIVVTADYHMPRALLELHAAMPGVALYPFPVATEAVDARRWWASPDDARRMVLEYCKYIVILIRNGLLSLSPPHQPEAVAPTAPANSLGSPS
jgi:uncharacterized SAM-binding protein YcdF (DUF218 family)